MAIRWKQPGKICRAFSRKADLDLESQAWTSKLRKTMKLGDFYKPFISSNLFRCLNGGVYFKLTWTFG
jgi:hypothetical protein